jgi:hypothetical protein
MDDGGVGMEEHQLEQAREIVSGRRLLRLGNLGEIPQTGMPVVGQYVHRHGFRVDLMPSPYGGVRAVVLVPAHMVENLEQVATPPPPAAEPRAGAALAGPASLPAIAAARAPAAGPADVPAAAEETGSLPQRRSRRRESGSPAPGSTPPEEATPPEQTPEQAGAWMAAYLSDSPDESTAADFPSSADPPGDSPGGSADSPGNE